MSSDPHDYLVLVVFYNCLDEGIWYVNDGHVAIHFRVDHRREQHRLRRYCRRTRVRFADEVPLLVASCNLAGL